MRRVVILEKIGGASWTSAEVDALVRAHVVVEGLASKPNRIVAMTQPLEGTFRDALGHSVFTAREVDYQDRWV